MSGEFTESDFEDLSWHDCHVWGFELRPPDPDNNDWRSELALDIDYIVEWICRTDGGATFRVAPATLVFRDVSDLCIDCDFRSEGPPATIQPASVDDIERTPTSARLGREAGERWNWKIALNWPQGGSMTFAASGFSMRLRREPVETPEQSLSPRVRRGG